MKSLAPLRRLFPTKASSTAPRFSLLLSSSVKPLQQINLHTLATYRQSIRPYTASSTRKMSSTFSNADTGSKPADPYKAKNADETSVKEKVDDLVAFIDACKFGMMTTRIESSGLLVSRCMALAAKVLLHARSPTIIPILMRSLHHCRKVVGSIFSSTPIPNQARLTTSKMTPKSTLLSWTHLASGPLFQAKLRSSPTALLSRNTTRRR